MELRPPADNDDFDTRRAQMARDETIMKLSGLVRSIARRYGGRGIPLDDLIQAGYLGLIQAVDRFDPTRGVPLRAYAARTIEGELMHTFRDQRWAVRVPRGLQESSTRVAAVRDDLIQSLGREPTLAEIAEGADLSVEEAREAVAVRKSFNPKSMAAEAKTVDPDPDVSPDEEFACEEPGYGTVLDRHVVGRAIQALPARERTILALRVYGDLTQSEIADRVGISQMHVSRLLRQAEGAVRARLDADDAA